MADPVTIPGPSLASRIQVLALGRGQLKMTSGYADRSQDDAKSYDAFGLAVADSRVTQRVPAYSLELPVCGVTMVYGVTPVCQGCRLDPIAIVGDGDHSRGMPFGAGRDGGKSS